MMMMMMMITNYLRKEPEKAGQEKLPVMASTSLICSKAKESCHKDSGNEKFCKAGETFHNS